MFTLQAMDQGEDSVVDFLKTAIDQCYNTSSTDPIEKFVANHKNIVFTEGQVLNYLMPRRAQEFKKLMQETHQNEGLIAYLKQHEAINKIGLVIREKLKECKND